MLRLNVKVKILHIEDIRYLDKIAATSTTTILSYIRLHVTIVLSLEFRNYFQLEPFKRRKFQQLSRGSSEAETTSPFM